MNKILKLAIGTGVLFVLLLIMILALSANYEDRLDQSYEDSFRSDYEYDIRIESHDKLHNVTLYLPVPVFENESTVANDIIAGDDWNRPSEWNFSLIDTEHGKMLQISAKEIKPVFHPYPTPIEEGEENEEQEVIKESHEYSEETPVLIPQSIDIHTNANHEINTKYPIGNESVLLPKYDIKNPYYKFRYTDENRISPLIYEYESRIYADYEASPDNEVVISIEFTGLNQWWTLGWNKNEYRDIVTVNLIGSQDGWADAKGKMITRDGVYD